MAARPLICGGPRAGATSARNFLTSVAARVVGHGSRISCAAAVQLEGADAQTLVQASRKAFRPAGSSGLRSACGTRQAVSSISRSHSSPMTCVLRSGRWSDSTSLTDHIPGRDALGRGHLIDGREDLPGQGGSFSCQRTQQRSLDVDGQQVRGARRPPQVRPEAFSCLGGGRQSNQQPEEMAGGRIAIGVGGGDHRNPGDALHVELADFEMRSQVQLVFQLVCEGGGYVGADLRKHRRSLRVGDRRCPFGGPDRSYDQPFYSASARSIGGSVNGAGVHTAANRPAPGDVALGFWTDLPSCFRVRFPSMTAWLPVTPRSPGEDEKLCPATPLKSNVVTSCQRVESAVQTGCPTNHRATMRGRGLTRLLLWWSGCPTWPSRSSRGCVAGFMPEWSPPH